MTMQVFVIDDDIDSHGYGCRCGLCNSNGRSYGVGIYQVGNDDEVLERVYAPSQELAYLMARVVAEHLGYRIVPAPES